MKYIITETQYEKLFEQEVLHIPDLNYVGGWDILQKILKAKGNPPYSIGGNLDLMGTPVKSLGNIQSLIGLMKNTIKL